MQCVQPYETDYGYYSANGTRALFYLNGEYTKLEFDLRHVDGLGNNRVNQLLCGEVIMGSQICILRCKHHGRQINYWMGHLAMG